MFAERAFLSRSLRKDTGGGSFCDRFRAETASLLVVFVL